ncbi:MAG: insulinase family protein, partial [Bacteroidales bacterium]|nr:insulinase family protein [Bacteroidales bacterium]
MFSLQLIDRAPLVPATHPLPNGNTLFYFPNANIDLVKLDFTFEAGSAYQQLRSQAHAANQLFGEATSLHEASAIAEFLDFRGIVVERMADVCQGNISFYFLRKYAQELFPLLREMFDHPLVTPQLFEAYVGRRRQTIATNFQQTKYRARNRFYELLYGFEHPMGCYATVDDLDLLTLDAVSAFMRQHYQLPNAHIILGGCVDSELLALADRYLAPSPYAPQSPIRLPQPPQPSYGQTDALLMPAAVQSSLRIGSVLPFQWDH